MTDTFFDRIYKNKTLHTPDVLSCLANLSNNEVFTQQTVFIDKSERSLNSFRLLFSHNQTTST